MMCLKAEIWQFFIDGCIHVVSIQGSCSNLALFYVYVWVLAKSKSIASLCG